MFHSHRCRGKTCEWENWGEDFIRIQASILIHVPAKVRVKQKLVLSQHLCIPALDSLLTLFLTLRHLSSALVNIVLIVQAPC